MKVDNFLKNNYFKSHKKIEVFSIFLLVDDFVTGHVCKF